MKRATKLVIATFLIIFTAVVAISVVLSNKSSLIAQDNFKVYADTKQVELKDKSGSNMPPFKYNLEAIAEGSPEENRIVGTDLYKFFEPLVMETNSKMTAYDEEIYTEFIDALKLYVDGKIRSKEEMINTFKKNVKSRLADIIVQ